MALGKKSFIRFSFPKLDLQLLIEKNPILMGKCSISKWAYKFDHDQLLSGLSHCLLISWCLSPQYRKFLTSKQNIYLLLIKNLAYILP